MSQDDLKNRMFSDNHEGDDFFLPSDRVWSDIRSELDEDKRKRRPFFILLFSIISLVTMLILVLSNKQNNAEPSSLSIEGDAVIRPHVEHQSIKKVEIAGNDGTASPTSLDIQITENDDRSTGSTHPATHLGSDLNLTKKLQSTEPITEKASPSISDAIPHTSREGSDLQQVATYSGTSRDSDISNTESLIFSSELADDQRYVTEERGHVLLEGNQHVYADQVEFNANTAAINSMDMSSRHSQLTDHENALESAHKSQDQSSRQVLRLDHLPSRFLSSIELPMIDQSKWYSNMTLVGISEKENHRSWSAELLTYSSRSSYSIQDYNGFNSVDFALTGELSFGYQLALKKKVAQNVSIGIGIGLDNAHFTADYGIAVNREDLTISELGANYQISLNKNIPSLAGGLATSFNLISSTQNLTTNNIRLNLAHNYRTLTAPIVLDYSIIQWKRSQLTLGTGLIFSKRLLAIDTGVNQLASDASGELVELASIAVIDQGTQPFRIYNISGLASLAINYALTNNVQLGLQSRLVRSAFNIYEDQNYKVRSQHYQVGLSLSYSFNK